MPMKKLRMNRQKLIGESAMKAVSAALRDVESAPTFGEYMDRLWSLSKKRSWVATLTNMADYAWQLLPKHRWMTAEQAQRLLGWDEKLIAPTFFQLDKRRKGRRARRMPEFWTSPRDHWGPPWRDLRVLLRPSDPLRKEIKLAEQYYQNPDRASLQPIRAPKKKRRRR